mgnify:CR=1 FL=1
MGIAAETNLLAAQFTVTGQQPRIRPGIRKAVTGLLQSDDGGRIEFECFAGFDQGFEQGVKTIRLFAPGYFPVLPIGITADVVKMAEDIKIWAGRYRFSRMVTMGTLFKMTNC